MKKHVEGCLWKWILCGGAWSAFHRWQQFVSSQFRCVSSSGLTEKCVEGLKHEQCSSRKFSTSERPPKQDCSKRRGYTGFWNCPGIVKIDIGKNISKNSIFRRVSLISALAFACEFLFFAILEVKHCFIAPQNSCFLKLVWLSLGDLQIRKSFYRPHTKKE